MYRITRLAGVCLKGSSCLLHVLIAEWRANCLSAGTCFASLVLDIDSITCLDGVSCSGPFLGYVSSKQVFSLGPSGSTTPIGARLFCVARNCDVGSSCILEEKMESGLGKS